MSLTPSEMESLARQLGFWERAEYVAEAFVIIGCVGELFADLATRLNEQLKKLLERGSTIVLIAALFISLIALTRTNILFGSIIGALGGTARSAAGSADKALTDSGTALSQAAIAKSTSDTVAVKIDKLAAKADALDKRINSASRRVAEAETRLAWRHIDPKKRGGYIARLKPYAGSEVAYDFDGLGNPEAEGFLGEFLSLLSAAGWRTVDRHNFVGGVQWVGITCVTARASKAGQALDGVVRQLPNGSIRHLDDRPIPAAICQIGIKPPP